MCHAATTSACPRVALGAMSMKATLLVVVDDPRGQLAGDDLAKMQSGSASGRRGLDVPQELAREHDRLAAAANLAGVRAAARPRAARRGAGP